MAQKKLPINIFKYSNYRELLSDLFDKWGETRYKWSFAKFSKEAGFAASNYLKQIIKGEKNLGKSGINKIVIFYHFNKSEITFFTNLVGMNQSKNDSEKEKYYQQLKKIHSYSKNNIDEKNMHRFYSKWYNPVIRELVTVNNFKNDPKWIAKQLSPKISEFEAKRSLNFLIKSNQVVQDESGKLTQKEPLLSTGKDVNLISVANYHKEMIEKAKESIEILSQSERNISSLTMAITPEIYDDIIRKIYSLQDKIIEMATSSKNSEPEEVCQLNFQLFPVTQIKKESRKK